MSISLFYFYRIGLDATDDFATDVVHALPSTLFVFELLRFALI